MFEKSLFDLIKGLRSHKGAEDEYIQNSLRECKAEIKSQDIDKKATALLKLIYLEMFGYDMSWASFHVLEVMSSAKYLQKRVGYLGAVQSFRPDTEVLMLATNLLKKDIASANIPNMSLPLATLPHVISPALAMSLLTDVLSRISHSHAVVRKKAVVSLYRLALVYPEALKLAWPKIKERLMDTEEDSSVTTAVINVVCELGWRRPHDFLPLAPRLFELLVDGGNNWMAIKIIKLFATLTPLEPRLIRKLLRPLANLMQTTTAMSLLYECINGIIQGGILESEDGSREQDEIARLCVEKLRGMVVVEADPNLKYVALLAFNRIVISHPALVATQQDVIINCVDDADISIRLQALDLVTGMVNSDTLQLVVDRLIDQLRLSALSECATLATDQRSVQRPETSQHSTDDGNLEKDATSHSGATMRKDQLPADYKIEVIHRIMDICSRNNYSDLIDFEWYIDVLVQLVKHIPVRSSRSSPIETTVDRTTSTDDSENVASRIGSEIRNVAVRVKDVRKEAARAAEGLLLSKSPSFFAASSDASNGFLGPIAWLVGEYAQYLTSLDRTLQSLIDPSNTSLPARTLSFYLQAAPKVFVCLLSQPSSSDISLLLARLINFLEALADHPDLDIQERATEFLEFFRLSAEAMPPQNAESRDIPFLLSSVMPSFFSGLELNPVAVSAQKKVPLPELLSLDQPFNDNLAELFRGGDSWYLNGTDGLSSQEFYYSKGGVGPFMQATAAIQLEVQPDGSYQDASIGLLDEATTVTKRKADRRERNRDDPFYIGTDELSSGGSTPFRQVLSSSNGGELDVDTIPIIDLKIDNKEAFHEPLGAVRSYTSSKATQLRPKKFDVAADETIQDVNGAEWERGAPSVEESSRAKRSLLQVDSSGLAHFSLEENDLQDRSPVGASVQKYDDSIEMTKAMEQVERLRLEMQRATERIQLRGVPSEGTLVKKKKKGKKPKATPGVVDRVGDMAEQAIDPDTQQKKKKKKRRSEPDPSSAKADSVARTLES